MAAPALAVSVEPFESGKVVYLPMAPGRAGEKARGRVMLRLEITNNESSPVVALSYTVGVPGFFPSVKPINMSINPGATLVWWFPKPDDHIVFDLPAPPSITLTFQCSGFAENANFTFPLGRHVSPVDGGAFLFPARSVDLKVGEFWYVNGCIHGSGDQGSQSFGYDMGVSGANHDDGVYDRLLPGNKGKSNADYRVWSKPVHAMAAGVVLQAINDCPDNPIPVESTFTADAAANQATMKAQENAYWGPWETANGGASVAHGGAGNHFYLQHGDEVVLYAHMQKGSLNKGLLTTGSAVAAGAFLGLAGNSGNASGPHLHIHAVKGVAPEQGTLRPFILKNTWAIDNDLVMGNPQKGFWSPLGGQGIPEGDPLVWNKKDVFIWPDHGLPEWPEIVQLGLPDGAYQDFFNAWTAAGFRPVWLDAFNVDDEAFFNLIFRPATGIEHVSFFGLTGDQYQAQHDTWVNTKGFRLTHIESYISHDTVCYAPMFVKEPGPRAAAYHGKSSAEHQALFDDLTKNQGQVLVNHSVVIVDDEAFHTALYEQRPVGAWEARFGLTIAEYQQAFDTNTARRWSLAYLNSFMWDDDVRIVAIWYQNLPMGGTAHHLDADEFVGLLKTQRKANLLLRGVTGYQRGDVANYAAVWRP